MTGKVIFNKNYAQIYHIKEVSPNGVIRFNRGGKAKWRMKSVRDIKKELPPLEELTASKFIEIKQKFHRGIGQEVVGRIIYNIYQGTFDEYL